LALASINFSSSRDLGDSLPFSPRLYPLLQEPPVQDSTVHSHTPLLDVRPRGWNQDKSVRYCVAFCINHLGLGTCSIITSWCRTIGSGHRHFSFEKINSLLTLSHNMCRVYFAKLRRGLWLRESNHAIARWLSSQQSNRQVGSVHAPPLSFLSSPL
jgi:hypothetical protein